MTACIVCKKSKGKFKCGCLCEDATIHKHCLLRLALQLYEKKTDVCDVCNVNFACLKQHHFSQAAASKLEDRLEHTGIRFGKKGTVPTCWSRFSSEKEQMQSKWEKAIEEELEDCPDFAEKTLRNAKKRKVEFISCSYSTKWD